MEGFLDRLADFFQWLIDHDSLGIFFVAIILSALALIIVLSCLKWYLACRMTGARVGLGRLILMRIRRISLEKVVMPFIAVRQVDHEFPIWLLEMHQLAGGSPLQVAKAYVKARQEGLPIDYRQLAALDLANSDPLAAVEACIAQGLKTEKEIQAVMSAAIEKGPKDAH